MGLEMFYNDTVTLFNRSYNAETDEEIYIPTLLENVNLVITKGANVSKSGMEGADAATLYVDMGNLTKPYIDPKSWAQFTDEEKQNYITFSPAEDFFVKGDRNSVELPESDAYEWMRSEFDDVYKVTNVDKYEDIMPHFEVGGV